MDLIAVGFLVFPQFANKDNFGELPSEGCSQLGLQLGRAPEKNDTGSLGFKAKHVDTDQSDWCILVVGLLSFGSPLYRAVCSESVASLNDQAGASSTSNILSGWLLC